MKFSLTSPKAIAEWITDTGREHYCEFGEVVPTLFFFGEKFRHGIIVQPHPRLGEMPTYAFAEIVNRIGKLHPWYAIACITETWFGQFDPEKPEPKLRRGQLEEMHEAGDERVGTAIVGMALDLTNRLGHHTVFSRAIGEPPDVSWDTFAMTGALEGELPESLLHAYDTALEPPEEMPSVPLELLCGVIIQLELVSNAVLLVPKL